MPVILAALWLLSLSCLTPLWPLFFCSSTFWPLFPAVWPLSPYSVTRWPCPSSLGSTWPLFFSLRTIWPLSSYPVTRWPCSSSLRSTWPLPSSLLSIWPVILATVSKIFSAGIVPRLLPLPFRLGLGPWFWYLWVLSRWFCFPPFFPTRFWDILPLQSEKKIM